MTTNQNWVARYVTTKGRAAVTRPSMYNDTRALFMVTDRDMSRFQDIDRASKKSVQQQKEWLVKEFPMAEWKIERLVKEMLKTDDFYMQEIAQVKMGNQGWAKGRVALCGDAAFCPSPITGMVSILFPRLLRSLLY
jgi:2-polyprenyl-6-methoxyphenol hydroxylase-like FAD-dependent oxidoreductase